MGNLEQADNQLIAAVLQGEIGKFELLIQKYQGRVFATVLRYARRESDIEDIVQEVFIKCFRKLSSFKAKAPFEHWLMRLTIRTCYDFLRAHQRNRETAFSELSARGAKWLEMIAAHAESDQEQVVACPRVGEPIA